MAEGLDGETVTTLFADIKGSTETGAGPRSRGRARSSTLPEARDCRDQANGRFSVRARLRHGADLVIAARLVPHRALSFEDRAILYDQLGSRELADDFRGWANLDSLRRGDFALDLAAHGDRIRANLRRHHGAFADRDFLAVNLTVNVAVDARWTLKVQLAADLRTAV